MKRILLAVTITMLALLVVVPVASAATTTLTKPERQLIALVNQARANKGLAALKVNFKLVRAARAHSSEMIAKDYFSHNSANGESVSKRVIRYGYTQTGCTQWMVGENIAYGVGSYGSPKTIMRAWMKSSAHRAIILTKSLREIGIGRAAGDYNGNAGTSMFTMDAGLRK
jgi:uncharacterized protein YkwD